LGIQKDLPWIPESLSPWSYLPSYSNLPLDVRLRYNQFYALATNEIFAVFERDFICPILQTLMQTSGLSDDKKELLTGFCREEVKHAEMFHRLNFEAEPVYYQNKDYLFSGSAAHPTGVFLMDQIKKFPQTFGVWVWIALMFEERSLMHSKEYLKEEPGKISEHFRQVHRWHMMEEVRHVQLDEFFAEEFYRPLASWKRWLTAWMMSSVVQTFQSPRRNSFVIAEILKKEFKNISVQQKIDCCLSELPTLRRNQDFQNKVFGPETMARTRRVMSGYSEMKSVLHLFDSI